MSEEEYAAESCAFLENPLNISDLCGPGTQFDIKTDFTKSAIDDMYDELNLGGSDDENDSSENMKSLGSPWLRPFAELRLKMEMINEFLYKMITIPGNASETRGLVPENARAAIRYSAYWENEGTPFDSSFLRGTTYNFITGKNEVLEGLETAVRTMREGESALFLIGYQLLFHELGCPPRIKPRADGLFKIELLKYTLVGDLNAVEQLPIEERNKFPILYVKVKEIHLKGLDLFGQRSFVAATRAFERAVDALNFCQLANEEEERQQQEMLIKLCTNLTVCYNKIDAPSKTCIMANELKRLTKNRPPCKAIFQEGRALLSLGDFKRARTSLERARKMEPNNMAIFDELKKLSERYERYMKDEREIWSKAIGVINESEKENNCNNDEKNKENTSSINKNKHKVNIDDDALRSDDRDALIDMIDKFKNCMALEKIQVPKGFSEDGYKAINQLAKQMDVLMTFSHLDDSYVFQRKTKK